MTNDQPDTIGGMKDTEWRFYIRELVAAANAGNRHGHYSLARFEALVSSAFALPAVVKALEDLRSACEEQYKACKISAEPFVRAGNVLAEVRR